VKKKNKMKQRRGDAEIGGCKNMEKTTRENIQKQKVNIRHFRELEVYQLAMNSAMRIFEASKFFPPEEKFSLTDQIRRSSRSVCANIAEACLRPRGTDNVCISAS